MKVKNKQKKFNVFLHGKFTVAGNSLVAKSKDDAQKQVNKMMAKMQKAFPDSHVAVDYQEDIHEKKSKKEIRDQKIRDLASQKVDYLRRLEDSKKALLRIEAEQKALS